MLPISSEYTSGAQNVEIYKDITSIYTRVNELITNTHNAITNNNNNYRL